MRLAKLALRATAEDGTDGAAYAAAPPAADEFSTDDEPLAWDAEGSEEFSARQ